MADSYWRERMNRALIAAENARADRMRALDEALDAVRRLDDEVLSPHEREALTAAARAVDALRRVW